MLLLRVWLLLAVAGRRRCCRAPPLAREVRLLAPWREVGSDGGRWERGRVEDFGGRTPPVLRRDADDMAAEA